MSSVRPIAWSFEPRIKKFKNRSKHCDVIDPKFVKKKGLHLLICRMTLVNAPPVGGGDLLFSTPRSLAPIAL